MYDIEADLDRLRIHFYTNRGQVVSILLVQYGAFIDNEWRAIVRFDEAHGFFHRDVMSPVGGTEKIVMPQGNKNRGLTNAIDHLKCFWPAYRQRYEDEYYGK